MQIVQSDTGRIRHLCPMDDGGLSLLTVVEHAGKEFAAIYKDDDARLIAAAPDMLEVLIEVDRENSAALASMKDDDIEPPNWFIDQCQKIKDAITKATGESA